MDTRLCSGLCMRAADPFSLSRAPRVPGTPGPLEHGAPAPKFPVHTQRRPQPGVHAHSCPLISKHSERAPSQVPSPQGHARADPHPLECAPWRPASRPPILLDPLQQTPKPLRARPSRSTTPMARPSRSETPMGVPKQTVDPFGPPSCRPPIWCARGDPRPSMGAPEQTDLRPPWMSPSRPPSLWARPSRCTHDPRARARADRPLILWVRPRETLAWKDPRGRARAEPRFLGTRPSRSTTPVGVPGETDPRSRRICPRRPSTRTGAPVQDPRPSAWARRSRDPRSL